MTTVIEKEPALIAAEDELVRRRGSRKEVAPVVPGVYACINAVSKELSAEGISKTRTNQQQGYRFRGIDDVHNALAPVLAKHGLVILPRCLTRDVVERQTKTGGVLFYVTIAAEFDFTCVADGSIHTVKMYGEAMDSADKATNKAMSAAYKYAAFQTFCIPTEGDDADAHTHDVVPAPTPTTATVPHAAGLSAEGYPAAATGENRRTLPTPGREARVGDPAARPTDPSAPNGGDSAISAYPKDAVLIERVDSTPTRKAGTTRYMITTNTGEQFATIKDRLAAVADSCRLGRIPCIVTGHQTRFGLDLEHIEVLPPKPAMQAPLTTEMGEESIPF